MAPYEANGAMQTRLLQRWGITATITPGDADAASDEVDQSGPFIGYKADITQARAFPRILPPLYGGAGTTPEAILDAVALLAYHNATGGAPAVTNKSTEGISRTYATPKVPMPLMRARALLSPYLLRVGQRRGGRHPGREVLEGGWTF